MKATIQLFSTQGYYGPTVVTKEFKMISQLGSAIVEALEQLPDNLEGVNLVDWRNIEIHVVRK